MVKPRQHTNNRLEISEGPGDGAAEGGEGEEATGTGGEGGEGMQGKAADDTPQPHSEELVNTGRAMRPERERR